MLEFLKKNWGWISIFFIFVVESIRDYLLTPEIERADLKGALKTIINFDFNLWIFLIILLVVIYFCKKDETLEELKKLNKKFEKGEKLIENKELKKENEKLKRELKIYKTNQNKKHSIYTQPHDEFN